jgi:outer membrane protein OmpA-like peptidoglycan-associated protein
MMAQRKSVGVLVAALVLPLFFGGCAGMNRTQQGAVIGAAGGAAVGAAAGKATGSTARGAVIGAAVGGVAGAVIGRQMDQQAAELAAELEGADVTRVEEGMIVTFPSGLMFDFDSSALRPGARTDLSRFAQSLQRYPNTEVQIIGHTDNVGSHAYNQRLSEQRAAATRNYLVQQGVASDRIRTLGRSFDDPVASNATAEGRQQNRRVEIAIFASEAHRLEMQRQHN